MYIENKYKKWYDAIIKKAQLRDTQGYVEKHHIIPKSLGGSNDKENIVGLTAREHFVCHWLLTKFISETFYKKKMLNALGKFVQCSPLQQRNMTSRQFQVARQAISEANKGRVYTAEMRKKISDANKGAIPWNKGLTGVQHYPQASKDNLKNLYSNKSFVERYGATKAAAVKEKMSTSKMGHTAGMTGKVHSDATRTQMSANMKGQRGPQKRTPVCPTCSATNVTSRHIKFCVS
jgi:hypothetical protein